MAETNNTRDLLATLRDALRALELTLPLARESVDEIASQAERIRDSVAALCDLRQREDTSVGIEMFVDAAVDFLEAFRALEAGILDVQAEVNSLEAELTDDEDGREGVRGPYSSVGPLFALWPPPRSPWKDGTAPQRQVAQFIAVCRWSQRVAMGTRRHRRGSRLCRR